MKTKTKRFQMRLTDEDKVIFAYVAEKLGRTESDMLRTIAAEVAQSMKSANAKVDKRDTRITKSSPLHDILKCEGNPVDYFSLRDAAILELRSIEAENNKLRETLQNMMQTGCKCHACTAAREALDGK
jgi:uncharacterized SAM-dependent methyltransferase